MFLASRNKTGSGGYDRTTSAYSGEVVFDGEIVGIFFDLEYTRAQTVGGITYHDTSSFTYDMNEDGDLDTSSIDTDPGRILEPGGFYGATNVTNSSADFVTVGDYNGGTNNYLRFGAENSDTRTGDYIRIIVKPNSSNTDPVADNESNSVTASTTLTVGDGADDVLTGDTDDDGDSLTVTGIRTGTEGGSGTSGSVGSGLAGTYGTLTIASDGTYTYVAGSSAGTDYFTYTVSDGNGGTDTAQITITVNATSNVAPVADDETNSVGKSTTLTVSDGADDVLTGDTDDDGDSLTVTGIRTGTEGGSGTSGSVGSGLAGTYGTLTIASDGTYTYARGSTAGTDYFTYTVSDGNGGTDTAQITITVNESITSTVEEDGSISVSDGASASSPDPVTVDAGSTLSTTNGSPRRMEFSSDGTKLFVLEATNDTITTHNLATAFDISSVSSSTTGTTLASNPHSYAYGIAFSADGTRMFTSDYTTKYVYQWTLTTPWDVSSNQRSSSDDLNTNSLYGASSPRDLTFSEDGTKLFLLGTDETVHQISLGTAWDLSTRITSPTDVELDLSSTITEGAVNGIRFSPNGKKFFINSYSKHIYEFSLATAWDLSSTSTYEGKFRLGSEIVQIIMEDLPGITTGQNFLFLIQLMRM